MANIFTVTWIALVATTVKLLLWPSYYSTDFEVHRHWMASTRTLPLSQWYTDETSEWTLDYPPFFAWFERALSIPAAMIDGKMVNLKEGLNHASWRTVLFQRCSVMVSDIMLFYSAFRYTKTMDSASQRLVLSAIYFSPGLFLVDHIHFQYNGFLLGILLLSLTFLKEGQDWLGGVTFACLICFKHLFAVAGPLYFVYLLRSFCWGPFFLRRFSLLGFSVVSVVGIAFGPFVYHGQIYQVLSRLFPFGRGLCHAYWAPNFWAIYNVSDKIFATAATKLGISSANQEAGSLTRGLVGDSSKYAALPQITPAVSLGLVLLSMLPCLVHVWRFPRREKVVRGVAHAYLCAFMFGWHVHEKAALHFVVPLALLVAEGREDFEDYLFLSTVTTYSLFPLLFEPKEYPIKVLILLLYTAYLRIEGKRQSEGSSHPLMKQLKSCYLGGFVGLELYIQVLHKLLFGEKLPFLPLLMISVYCSLGITFMWLKFTCQYLGIVPIQKGKCQ